MSNRAQNGILYGIICTIPIGLAGGFVGIILWWALIGFCCWLDYRRNLVSPETMQKHLQDGTFDNWYYQVYGKDVLKYAEEQAKLPPEERQKPTCYGFDKLGITPEEVQRQLNIEFAARASIDQRYHENRQKTSFWKDSALRRAVPAGDTVVMRGDEATRWVIVHRTVKGVNKPFHVGTVNYGPPDKYPFEPVLEKVIVKGFNDNEPNSES